MSWFKQQSILWLFPKQWVNSVCVETQPKDNSWGLSVDVCVCLWLAGNSPQNGSCNNSGWWSGLFLLVELFWLIQRRLGTRESLTSTLTGEISKLMTMRCLSLVFAHFSFLSFFWKTEQSQDMQMTHLVSVSACLCLYACMDQYTVHRHSLVTLTLTAMLFPLWPDSRTRMCVFLHHQYLQSHTNVNRKTWPNLLCN